MGDHATGRIIKQGAPPSPRHDCHPPRALTRWPRRRLLLNPGTEWECECGKRYLLEVFGWGHRPSYARWDCVHTPGVPDPPFRLPTEIEGLIQWRGPKR